MTAARAAEHEREQLGALFAELCTITSPTGEEGPIAARVRGELEGLGLDVDEDDAAARCATGAGNLLTRIPGPAGAPTVLLCAHLDTVAVHGAIVEPVLEDGAWTNARDAILGAESKAAVAVLLQAARRWVSQPPAVGVELLLTVGAQRALSGISAFDCGRLRCDLGFVFDHASPIGEVVIASPTAYALQATFTGRAAHAGLRPQDGRSAVLAAARAIGGMRLGRLDDETTANVAAVCGGDHDASNVVPDRCVVIGEARSLSGAGMQDAISEMVDRCHDAANEPDVECDVAIDVQRTFGGYRHKASAAPVLVAEAALRACGYEPRRILTGGASEANVLVARGRPVVCLANGTQRPHEPGESVPAAALEGMLDVTHALLEAAAAQGASG